MHLEFVSNTGCYLVHGDTVIGMDLWFTQGCFEGSWFHFPPLRKTQNSIEDCKYIYVSHIHPDHFDIKTLQRASKDTVVIVPDYFGRLLERKLNAFGLKNVISVGHEEVQELECGARITLFRQFIPNLYSKAQFGNLIDSAIVIEWDGKTILNCNDNYLDEDSAHKIKKQFPSIDLALMPHSASGPYPASFRNLSTDDKEREAARLQSQYINHFVDMVKIVQPSLVVPCAAEYAIVGEQYHKNPHVGLAAPADAVAAVNEMLVDHPLDIKAVHLDCGTILDVDSGEVTGLESRNPDMNEKMSFAQARRDIPYPCDWESGCNDINEFDDLMQQARGHVWKFQERLNWKRNYNIYLYIDELPFYTFNFNNKGVTKLEDEIVEKQSPYLECFLSEQLLYRILTRRAHWNNAEGGLHIDFYREPNDYVPEVFTLLSFLHVPPENLSGNVQ